MNFDFGLPSWHCCNELCAGIHVSFWCSSSSSFIFLPSSPWCI